MRGQLCNTGVMMIANAAEIGDTRWVNCGIAMGQAIEFRRRPHRRARSIDGMVAPEVV
jgi:hypothetical protein